MLLMEATGIDEEEKEEEEKEEEDISWDSNLRN
jgi:hypothetical protein